MKLNRILAVVISTGCAALLAPALTAAATITLDFNAVADNASNSAVQTYITSVIDGALGTGKSTGFTITGSKGEKNYTGDSYVTGPPITPSCVEYFQNGTCKKTDTVSETLGTSDGNVHHGGSNDTFLVNVGADRITMDFPFEIYGVSFDFEIFPNARCPNGGANGCPNTDDPDWPDFTFEADDKVIFKAFGADPESDATLTYRYSPHSKLSFEAAPQLLSVSGLWQFADGVTKLEFIDWPVMIGIDNLVINTTPPERIPPPNGAPEPGTLALLGLGLAGLAATRRRRQ